MSLTAEVAKDVRKGTLFYLGKEFTLQFDQTFMRTHREEYLMYIELVRRLRQKTFDDRRNAWNIPVAEDAVKCLNQIVAYGIAVTKDARAKLQAELTNIARIEGVAQAIAEEKIALTIAGPNKDLNEAMKNYQKEGVLFMSTVERSYNGDEMGLGKSLQALAMHEHKLAYPALITCPSKLKQNWLNECRLWLPHRRASMLANDLAEITILSYTELPNLVNYELAHPKAKVRKAAMAVSQSKRFFFPDIAKPVSVLCDEGHFIKSDESMRTQCVTAIASLSESRYRTVLSGTPIENGRPYELLAPLKFLGRINEFGGEYRFMTRYCGKTKFGIDKKGALNTGELHARLKKICYIRREKKNVLKELPDKIQSVTECELDNWPEYRRIKQDVTSYMMAQRGRLLTDKESSAQAMIKMGMLRKACGMGKVNWIIEWIDTFLESGEKFVIYATHREVQEALVKGLSRWNPAVVLGGCKDVQAEQDKFARVQSCRLFIGSTIAAGFGINLTCASHIGLAELMWTDSKHQQVIDRCHRTGQKDCVNAYYFLARNTIDDVMWDVVSNKARINASVVSGEDVNQKSVLADLIRQTVQP